MINEQIQKAIEKEVDKKLKESLSIFSLPLISQYKVFSFHGRADGTDLTLGFNIEDIVGRILVLKSLKIYPYYFGTGNDIWLFDGVTNSVEATYNNQRINKITDDLVAGTKIDLFINGGLCNIFLNTGIKLPLDISLDNIFYKHPEKIASISMRVTSSVINDLTTGALVNPNVKVVVECYLL